MSRSALNRVLAARRARQWSQAELARRAGISRAAISAIEGERLSPSVNAALSLAVALESSVEELFGRAQTAPSSLRPSWAWHPSTSRCRYWEAVVNGRRLVYPVEAFTLNSVLHDGLWEEGVFRASRSESTDTLVLACCDPAAGLLANEYARVTGFRLLVFPRSGASALELLRQGLVHGAGLHRSTPAHPNRNVEAVQAKLDAPCRLVHVAEWEEGIALPPTGRVRSPQAVAGRSHRWAAREPGSAARECLDELLGGRKFSGREVATHAGVAEAVRAGWAEAGVCVRISAEDAGLNFLPLRSEMLDLCFTVSSQNDPRVKALVRLLGSRAFRRVISELPGYHARRTGEVETV